MPVDFFVCLLPLLIVATAIPALFARHSRKAWLRVSGGLLALFLLIYFVPGWVLWVASQGGDADAQYRLGNYYWSRLGYNWPNVEARDKWWLEAARQGHPRAMYQVGYFSMYGTSRYIPRDLSACANGSKPRRPPAILMRTRHCGRLPPRRTERQTPGDAPKSRMAESVSESDILGFGRVAYNH